MGDVAKLHAVFFGAGKNSLVFIDIPNWRDMRVAICADGGEAHEPGALQKFNGFGVEEVHGCEEYRSRGEPYCRRRIALILLR